MIIDRILQIIEYKDISKSKFYKETGLSNGFLDKVKDVGASKLEYILNTYPDISPEWLLLGKGYMIKTKNKDLTNKENVSINVSENDYLPNIKNTLTNEVNEEPIVFRLRTDKNIEIQEVPLYNLEATAGIVTLFADSSMAEVIDTIKIPNLPKCDGALYVTGDSMYPLLKSGDIIMYKKINNIADNIFWGEMYLLSIDNDGDELLTCKYIQKSEKGEDYVKLVSQNQHHQDKDILISRINALALIKASVRINSMY